VAPKVSRVATDLVEGPGWTGFGLQESAGRYPLRVETAVSRIVDQLLPGVITTTRHARMYCVHALVWAEARTAGLDENEGQDLARRCEAVIAAIYVLHEPHRIELSSAHGEDRIGLFLTDDSFDVVGAAARGTGISQGGFAGVYQGPCVRLGALSGDSPPRPGPRADEGALREGLDDLLDLARRDSVSTAELRASTNLCLCGAADGADGRWLRRILVEQAEEGSAEDRQRQLTCLLLLDTLHEQPSSEPVRAFREHWAFGDPLGETASDDRAMVATLWRAAALRNYSVGAWRALWRWLAEQLNEEAMSAERLGERLGDALGDLTVGEMIADLPARTKGVALLPAEAAIADEPWTPLSAVRQLATGAGRLENLDEPTLKAFVGTDPQDLGPRWVAGLLEEWRDRPLRSLADELAVILVRRAKRVSLSKMYLTKDGKPFVPTRLRDRDGLLSVRGQEGAGDVALRTDSLANVLAGLGVLTKDDTGAYAVTDYGEELRASLA
jgi:hypothetical protein